MKNLFKRLGVDLGTTNSLVWEVGKGIVLSEPTVVAVSAEDRKVLAVGKEAKTMLGKTPGYIEATRPMREGVIADYEVTEAMLRYFLQKVMGRGWFFKPEVMVCVPAGVTQVEQRAVLEATLSAGAKNAYLIDEPLAAAIGAKIPVASSFGNMIVDIGGGAAEAAVIALGGVVVHKSVRVAGDKIDEMILSQLKKRHNLIVGDQTAELIKIKIGSAMPRKKEEKMEVKGRDSVYGLPKTVELGSSEVHEMIQEPLKQILGAIKGVLEETAPELVSDIVERGIVLSGGTSQLRDFDKYVTEEIGVVAHVVEDPQLCVVRGTGVAIENLDLYRRVLR